jgi:transposase
VEEGSSRMPYSSKWTAEQKIAIVMESLNTNISVAELCRKHNVTPNAFYGWKEKFLDAGKLGLTGSLKTGPSEELVRENESLKKLIGELTIANSALKKALTEGGKRR